MPNGVSWTALTFLGLLVALFAALIQERKLKFDLFAKRFEAYEGVNDGINARVNEIMSNEKLIMDPPDVALRAFWRACRLVRPLYPKAISDHLSALEDALLQLSIAHTMVIAHRGNDDDRARNMREYNTFLDARKTVDRHQTALAESVAPILRQETALELLRRKWSEASAFR
jgi:hypothetical protein